MGAPSTHVVTLDPKSENAEMRTRKMDQQVHVTHFHARHALAVLTTYHSIFSGVGGKSEGMDSVHGSAFHARGHADSNYSKMTITNPHNKPSMACWVTRRAPRGRETVDHSLRYAPPKGRGDIAFRGAPSPPGGA